MTIVAKEPLDLRGVLAAYLTVIAIAGGLVAARVAVIPLAEWPLDFLIAGVAIAAAFAATLIACGALIAGKERVGRALVVGLGLGHVAYALIVLFVISVPMQSYKFVPLNLIIGCVLLARGRG